MINQSVVSYEITMRKIEGSGVSPLHETQRRLESQIKDLKTEINDQLNLKSVQAMIKPDEYADLKRLVKNS